ncbi:MULTISPECIES: hypothetical protein [unclassified Roseobacter]|uniref:hypothetical protein n=2 Tax=Alphaproteobacteria TaxID=28211 RepID=UPI00149247B3|nr:MULTISPECIES: hypothetical protein [unclassified Roseobacter]NNV46667.1 hypothetical protein [Roseobacter sp. HKCCD6265]NNV98111.1 hypothetical protein [Roseobacter sp. HKCCD6505]NNW10874.1 hypothetical protein [Roseobacter sp. HKCCD8484]NNX17462.1 hypothetical protein [Roseobacter sp. HKCCD8979]NNX98288.1 hypothetical protein [Roseobacter sp. HKCCD9066]NNY37230.1 hypothetical protein [Roseobacter sp. HKCCD9019]NNY66905.1 hypothetical protein [Roseobacter sp. HKCCD8419]NNY92393.1 hypothe
MSIAMLQTLSLSSFLRPWRVSREPSPRCRWRRDPLSHPDIARMDKRELADLPIDPYWIDPE